MQETLEALKGKLKYLLPFEPINMVFVRDTGDDIEVHISAQSTRDFLTRSLQSRYEDYLKCPVVVHKSGEVFHHKDDRELYVRDLGFVI